ncbi:TKL/DICTY4 protein kinase [Salpingoeca rosetta]|uniref:non-specific serine/threonine protein kinase n=1 Tax=Salpingoeca rosetta (strain ATCC 50818 / BSB-021) TaxID=946362 RepID=F2UQP9_SALR5|nr:TKL/DICTY4 protein kinase [Salpingoeca rosetta]EGD79954.1 TKL/DICTY4 protein kinase [Salpingoeca rosetta]|eukprot:XP_004988575.1 TKL/DICTY4 protein kinase [Salpingoeca rosetta]
MGIDRATKVLCADVDATLLQLHTTLTLHNVPFIEATRSPHFRRSRRAEGDATEPAGQCALAHVIDGSCTGPRGNGTLVVTVRGNEQLNATTDATALQAIAPAVRNLTLNGVVHETHLQWIAASGDWNECTTLQLAGLQFYPLNMHVLNAFPAITILNIQHSEALQAIDTRGFEHAGQLRSLDLQNNSLTAVSDEALTTMTALRVLDLRDNRIRHVTNSTFRGITALRQLRLGQNLISQLAAAAFRDMTALEELLLNHNAISTIPAALFRPLTQLKRLNMERNPLVALDAAVFGSLALLDHLTIEYTLLASIPPTLFSATTRLTRLDLGRNVITSLSETIFAGLSSVMRLIIDGNRLSSLPPMLFRDMTSLTLLFMGTNALTSLPHDLLRTCTELQLFECANSELTALPHNFFHNNNKLIDIQLVANNIRTLDGVLDASSSFPALRRLGLARNQFTQLHLNLPLPSLETLILNHNPMHHLPATTHTPNLTELRMYKHRMQHINLTPLFSLKSLKILELDADPDISASIATLDGDATLSSNLRTLSMQNVDVSRVVDRLLPVAAPLQLHVLGLGWPGASDATLPVQLVCGALARDVRALRLTNTQYEALELCRNKTIDALHLQRNAQLQSITVHSGLGELNVSACRQLTTITAPSIDVLDISSTRMQAGPALCTRWGRRVLFARHLDEDFVNLPNAAGVMRTCVLQADVIDLSGNAWLNNPDEVNRVVSGDIVLSPDEFVTFDSFTIESRPTPPILQLTNAPISCELELSSKDMRLDSDRDVVSNEVVYSFRCTCARGFGRTSRGRCVLEKPNTLGVAAASVVSGLIFGVAVALLSRRYRGLTKRIDLQEQLLVERDEEVMALKKAWEIEYDELTMIKRVAAGAFGVVFKAQWETVTVAVKVLQQSVMMFDESTVQEFEKEVEFLQRTRHPHVVRFFGAGTDPNGSPFLVLEYVAMGSLNGLLQKDMGKVLLEVRSRKVEESSNGSVRDDVNSVWDLKLRLLRDVASGMAFIHSLDQVHRDLKSGNVLVSARLRAKITDFGSIRQCLAGGSSASSSSTTATTATTAMTTEAAAHAGDLTYSQAAGTATMNPSMTMTAGVGTPLYMAPEVLLGDKYNAKADVFSFGVLMWEVATQRVPDLIQQEKGSGFRGPMLATLSNLLQEGKRLRFDDTAIATWFQSLTFKCMAQEARDRPTFQDLQEQFDSV